jgi:hypothetical protein
MNSKAFFKQHTVPLVLGLLLVISSATGGYALFARIKTSQQLEKAQSELKVANEKSASAIKLRGEQKALNDALAKELQTALAEAQGLKSATGAFAKQAAACALLKKQLRIK